MSRLLLAKAARVMGRELTAWPDLLSDYELAVLEAEDTQVNPCDIVNLLIADPPNISGYMVPRFWSLFFDGRWIDFRKEQPPRPLFTRDDYRAWPARDWPPSPLVASWLASAGVAEHSPRPETEPVKRKATESRGEALRAVVDAIESRANEIGYPFDRAEWPGTRAEFRAFLLWRDAGLHWKLPADAGRLSDELRPLGVKFAPSGRAKDKGRKFYKALFPSYPT